MRENSFVIPRGASKLPTRSAEQACSTVKPLVIREAYKVGALPSYRPGAPTKHTAQAVRPRPSVVELQRKRDARAARLGRIRQGVVNVGGVIFGAFVLYVLMFIAALWD